jgi:hypothetical protein
MVRYHLCIPAATVMARGWSSLSTHAIQIHVGPLDVANQTLLSAPLQQRTFDATRLPAVAVDHSSDGSIRIQGYVRVEVYDSTCLSQSVSITVTIRPPPAPHLATLDLALQTHVTPTDLATAFRSFVVASRATPERIEPAVVVKGELVIWQPLLFNQLPSRRLGEQVLVPLVITNRHTSLLVHVHGVQVHCLLQISRATC